MNGLRSMRCALRHHQTVRVVERLSSTIGAWSASWHGDTDGRMGLWVERHATHLSSIDAVVGGGARLLVDEAAAVARADLDEGALYERCRRVDEAAAWIHRLFEFYRARLDQRREVELCATVIGADEIVWSIYHQVMSAPAVVAAGVPHGAAPLACVEDDYTPASLDGSQSALEASPPWLVSERDPALAAAIGRLAVPIVTVPRWSTDAPWWLIFVAHEVGHQLTLQLGIGEPVAEAIAAKVRPVVGWRDAGRWRHWADEALADAWSMALVGPAAMTALSEMVLASDPALRYPHEWYPPALLRMGLMAAQGGTADGMAPAFAAREPEARPGDAMDLAANWRALGALAAVLEGPLPGGFGSMTQLVGLRGAAFAEAAELWAARLAAGEEAASDSLPAARTVIAGGFAAWQGLRHTAQRNAELDPAATDRVRADFDAGVARLADHLNARLAQCGPPGTRAGQESPPADATTAAALVQRLMSLASHHRLPAPAPAP